MRVSLGDCVDGTDDVTFQACGGITASGMSTAGNDCAYGVNAAGQCNPLPGSAPLPTASPVPGLTLTPLPATGIGALLSNNSTLIVAGCAILGLLFSMSGGKR